MKPLLILSFVAAIAFGGLAVAQTTHDTHGSKVLGERYRRHQGLPRGER